MRAFMQLKYVYPGQTGQLAPPGTNGASSLPPHAKCYPSHLHSKGLDLWFLNIHVKTLIFLRQKPLVPIVRKLLLPAGGRVSLELLCAQGRVADCSGTISRLETVCSTSAAPPGAKNCLKGQERTQNLPWGLVFPRDLSHVLVCGCVPYSYMGMENPLWQVTGVQGFLGSRW